MATPMASPMPSPLRSSPVQQIQLSLYTNALITPLRTRTNTQHLRDAISHAHPEPQRWQNPGGWGARHMNDKAPFTLWDEENRQFRGPSREERTWIRSKFGEGDLLITGWLLCIETAHPPQPIPLTCGTMPIIFVRPGEMFHQPIPTSGYSNPRVPDPCPTVWWPRMTNPSKSQITEVLTAIADLANVTAVNFLPAWTVFELETGDDRNYELASLPGIVAGRTALYHHDDMPFTQTMRSRTRPRIVDPPQTLADGTIVQDNSNYLRQSALTPGCRVESGPVEPGTLAASVTAATTCGIKMRNLPGEEVLTVANHGFLSSRKVYHPFVNGGDLIGNVIDTRPELDIALIKLTPAASVSFTNSCYLQTTPPTRLLEGFQVPSGSWSEVDGMSSGLFSLMKEGCRARRPQRPIGHPEVNFTEWHTEVLFRVFGNVSSPISDGVCGAPIVDIESGGVVGFFHLSDGVHAYSAELDDLVAEGWGLV